jgi:hypothetical protein
LYVSPPWAIGEFSSLLKGVVLDMLKLIIIGGFAIYVIKLTLKHNIFISSMLINLKFLGLHIEINSKEKKHPSDQE